MLHLNFADDLQKMHEHHINNDNSGGCRRQFLDGPKCNLGGQAPPRPQNRFTSSTAREFERLQQRIDV